MSEQCTTYDTQPQIQEIRAATNCSLCGAQLFEFDEPDHMCSDCRAAQAQAELLGIPWIVDDRQFASWLADMRFPASVGATPNAGAEEEEAEVAAELAMIQPLADRVYDAVSDSVRAPDQAQTNWVVAETIAQMKFMLRGGDQVVIPGVGTLSLSDGGKHVMLTAST